MPPTKAKLKKTPAITDQELRLAQESGRKLSLYLKTAKAPTIHLVCKGKNGESIALPPTALHLLTTILTQMSEGKTVELVSVEAELTTQQAADLLNVSRPYLVALLEDGKIPFRCVGSRRRVLAKDVISYKTEIDKKRLAILAELSKEAQKNNMGY